MTTLKNIVIVPYKIGSRSAKIIQEKLKQAGNKVLRVRKGKPIPRNTDYVLRWGGNVSADKITVFNKLKSAGVSIPEYTTDMEVAKTWEGKIFARTLTRACAGRGIVICDKDTLVKAPLYTKFIDKDAEYRVHVFKGEVIDYSKKVFVQENDDLEFEESEYLPPDIGSHNNGFIFIRKIKHLDDNINLALSAVKALGLDYGAVDIIRKDKKSYVLEVNSACGMCETTSNAYTNAILKDIANH